MTLRFGAPRQIMIYAFITLLFLHTIIIIGNLFLAESLAQTTVYRPIARGNWPRAYQIQISDPEQFFYYAAFFFFYNRKYFADFRRDSNISYNR